MYFWVINSLFLIAQSAYGFVWSPRAVLVLLFLNIPWLILTLKGWKVGLKGAVATGLLVNVLILLTAFFQRQPKLIFLALLSCFLWYVFSVWFLKQIQRSYIGSGREWFQGLPTEIPGLLCEVVGLGIFKIARFDREGALLFSEDSNQLEKLKKIEPKEVIFQFQNASMTCSGKWSKIRLDSLGLGILFSGMSPDREKELGDFFEKIKGAGHEAAGI